MPWEKHHGRGRWGTLVYIGMYESSHICFQTVGPCNHSYCSLHADHVPGIVLSASCVIAQPNIETFYRWENRGSERLSHLSKITLSERGGWTRILSPSSLASESVLVIYTHSCLLTWLYFSISYYFHSTVPHLACLYPFFDMVKNITGCWHTMVYQAFYYWWAFNIFPIFLPL